MWPTDHIVSLADFLLLAGKQAARQLGGLVSDGACTDWKTQKPARTEPAKMEFDRSRRSMRKVPAPRKVGRPS